jgi:glycosyltransferase involved in cell wall biosynthesis
MNVLMVTAYPPVLGRHGGGVRMYHNIRILSSRHRVHVISFVDSAEEQDRVNAIGSICESVTTVRRVPDFRPHWLSVTPFLAREFSTPAMSRAIEQAIQSKRIDVMQCEYLQMAQFRRPGLPSILTAHEALSRNARDAYMKEGLAVERLRLFYRWMQMLRYEILQVRKFDRVVTMTGEDARYLGAYAPEARIRAIPIGVDTEEFSPVEEDPGQPLTALFIGNFRHFPNVEAARFLVERIAPRFPQVRFLISGDHAPMNFETPDNVSFPGYIADTRPLYRRPNTIVVTPLFSGAGQRVKLLEAFAMGCPVITTALGAAGFPIENGAQALLADTLDEFTSALATLIRNAGLRRSMGDRGRRMILEGFGWNQLAREYLDVAEEVAVSH